MNKLLVQARACGSQCFKYLEIKTFDIIENIFLYYRNNLDLPIHSTLNWPIVKSEKLKIEYFRFDI